MKPIQLAPRASDIDYKIYGGEAFLRSLIFANLLRHAFRAHVDGRLTPLGSGQFPLTSGAFVPSTIMVVGSE